MKRLYILSIFFIVHSLAGAFESTIVVQNGHSGIVNNIAVSEDSRYIITSGFDNKIKVFDKQQEKLVKEIFIYDGEIEYLALNPAEPQIAVIVKRGENYYLETYNWFFAKRLRRIKISDKPLFISYSPKGTYLALIMPSWNSLRIYNKSGSLINFPSTSGILSFLFFSNTEQTLVTYKESSQELTYWDMKSKKIKANIKTAVKIKSPAVYSPRIMIGKDEQHIYAIDMYTGSIIDSIKISARDIINVDNKIIVTENTTFPSIQVYSIKENKLKLDNKINASSFLAGATSITADRQGKIICGTDKGELKALDITNNKQKIYLKKLMTTIKDISFSKNTAFCATSDFTLQWESSIFSSSPKDDLVKAKKLPVDFADAGIKPIEGTEKVLIWSTEYPAPPRLIVYNYRDEIVEKEITDLTAYVKKALINDNSISLLEKDSIIRILDRETFTEKLRIPAKGINDIAYISENIIYAARTRNNTTPYSLIKIDTLFGETLPIDIPAELIYKLLTDKSRNRVYFLTVSSTPATSIESASINQNNGNIYSRRKLYDIGTIDSDADIIIDNTTGYLYTTVGFTSPVQIKQSTKKTFEASGHIPRKLAVFNKILYSINSDGSISMWNTTTGNHLYDVYIFSDGSWLIEGKNGELIPSSTEIIKNKVYQLPRQ